MNFVEELGVSRDTGDSGTNLAEILSNALPPSSTDKIKEKSSDSSVSQNTQIMFTNENNCFFFRMVVVKLVNQHQHHLLVQIVRIVRHQVPN